MPVLIAPPTRVSPPFFLSQVEFAEAGKAKVFYSNLYRTMLFPRFLWEEDAAGRTVHRSAFSGKAFFGENCWL